jgi:hypothetical protein
MRSSVLVFVVLATACVAVEPDPAPAPRPPHETFLANPTRIEAESVRILLPVAYRRDLRVSGLSAGFRSDGPVETWEGTGACEFDLLALAVRCRSLHVTLCPPSGEPEVVIQAEGDVSWSHVVRGLGSEAEGLSFLMLRNDRSLVR